MKRGRDSGSLTGGTGDVNAQFLSYSAAQSGADATTTTTTPIPIQRLPSGGKAQVMEVLKVFVSATDLPASASATETLDQIIVSFSTSSFGTTVPAFSEARVFAMYKKSTRSAFTAAGTYMSQLQTEPFEMDLTDGAGHGFIVATDNIFTQVSSTATGNTNVASCKIMYRWKNVNLQEYIGVVQSQQ